MKLIIVEKQEINLPFTIETDRQGRSWIEERDGKLHYMNRLGFEIIENKEIDERQARYIIKTTLEDRRFLI